METLSSPQLSEVQAIRQALGLSKRELADRLGVHPRTIARWERGGRIHDLWRQRLHDLVAKQEVLSPHGS